MERKLNVAMVGGSGACGRELISQIIKNSRFSKVKVFTRRILPEWEPLLKDPNSKLEIHKVDSLDGMKGWDPKLMDKVDTCFCCLGGRTKTGDAEFYKTDYTYYVEFGEYAKAAGVPHYSIISSSSASPTSWFYYFKVKGMAEEAIKKIGFPFVSIFRPGVLLNRNNDSRFGEKLAGMIPFLDKIEVKILAEKMMKECVHYHLGIGQKPKGAKSYSNQAILLMNLI